MTRKVVFFCTCLGRGGAETQLVRLASALKDRGWEPTMVSMLDRNLFTDELAERGIPYVTLNIERGKADPRAATRLAKVLRETRPDVFCSFLVAANTVGRPVARLLGVPVVVSSIRTPMVHSAKREWMLRLTRAFHDKVVFNSQTVADDAVARGLVPRGEVEVIRNGLDMAPFDEAAAERASARAELGMKRRDFMWLIVGHLRPEKNYPGLVRAFRRLHAEHPRVRLVSAGGFFQDHAEVLALAPDLIESGVIQLLGIRRDVARLFAAADAFVLSSHYDASPNGLIEALASRLPSVATRVGGVAEIVSGEELGILAPTSSADDIHAAMARLMALTPAARRKLGEAGRLHAEARFGRQRMVDEWEGLFLRLLAAKGRLG